MQTIDWGPIAQKTSDDIALRNARRYAHTVFDKLWCSRFQRTKAYEWLGKQMGLRRGECHIATMTLEQCREVVRLVEALQPQIEDRDPNEKRFERRRREPIGM